jgi:hypothetical protein
MIRLNNDINNFYNSDIIYKDVFEDDYPTIKDVFVTENFVGVILGQKGEQSKELSFILAYLYDALYGCHP